MSSRTGKPSLWEPISSNTFRLPIGVGGRVEVRRIVGAPDEPSTFFLVFDGEVNTDDEGIVLEWDFLPDVFDYFADLEIQGYFGGKEII